MRRPRLARHGGAKELRMPSEADARAENRGPCAAWRTPASSVEPDFPSGLAALDPPPPMIGVLGDPAPFKREMVAVVGARNASALGIKFATRLADLGAAGLVVASDLER
jgi:DNA processing protein